MTRYTVTYARRALDGLAGFWLNARDRQAVANAGDEIDRVLRVDALQKGFAAQFGFRQLIVSPLIAEFTVNEPDRIVTFGSFVT